MTKHEAMVAGIEKAKAMGLDKPLDVALCIQVALMSAGYRIIRAPKAEAK